MIGSKSRQPAGRSANFHDYDGLFILQVHRLIKLGYDRLDWRKGARDEETAITGDLVEAIEAVLDDPTEDWMKYYFPHDDPPENELERGDRQRRRGRHRKRVDIRLVSSEESPRRRFRFECKRLGRAHGARRYLGSEGLGCFLRGEYAAQEARAGMLGYVQCDDERTWSDTLGQLLAVDEAAFSVIEGKGWQHEAMIPELQHTYRSTHRRSRGTQSISIYHTLLKFC